MHTPTGVPPIDIKDLSVEFGPIKALDGVSLEIPAGQVIGLVGHNGAGKSTLVNAITGAVRPAAGEIRINGQPVDHSRAGDPLSMARLGMRVIHQEPSLAGVLSIADNITFKTVGENKSRKERTAIAKEALARVGSDLDPERRVSTLGFGDRQIVDLARALLGDVKALLLDEPTAALGRAETDRLHGLLVDLAGQGKAIVYVSHRLRDILEVCHRVVVLREGRLVMDRSAEGITPAELSNAVSPDAAEATPAASAGPGPRETAVRAEWDGQDYHFGRGEVVGLFGMAGGPQFKFAKALYGLRTGGMAVELGGISHRVGSPREAAKLGIFYVSADRERESLFHFMSALSNLSIPWLDQYNRFGLVQRKRLRQEYRRARDMLNIVGPPMEAAIVKFSGGNRQKHVLGRWLTGTERAHMLVLCQPNQGVDIGARADIARALQAAADRGLTVLVASSEVDEISRLATRAYVCETTPWTEVSRGPDFERALMTTLLAGVRRRGDRG
jgi:ABC-type sugar transport system ATPase subunit